MSLLSDRIVALAVRIVATAVVNRREGSRMIRSATAPENVRWPKSASLRGRHATIRATPAVRLLSNAREANTGADGAWCAGAGFDRCADLPGALLVAITN